MDIADAHAAAGGGSAAVGTTADAQTGKSLLDAFSFWSCSPSFDHRSSYSEGAVKKEGLIDPLGLSSFGAIEEDEMEIGETPSLEISGHESNPSNGFQNGLGGEYFAEASGDFGGSASAGVDVGWMQQPKVELQTTARKQCWDDGGFSLQELSVPPRRLPSTTPSAVRPSIRMTGRQPNRVGCTESLATAAAAGFIAQNPSVTLESPEDEEKDEVNGYKRDDREAGGGAEPACQLDERRRRNREHAKRSRMRKSARLGGLENVLLNLKRENARLRQIVKREIPNRAKAILRECAAVNTDADLVAKQSIIQGMRPSMTIGGSSGTNGGGSLSKQKLQGGNNSGYNSSNLDSHVPSALKLMSPCVQSVKALSESQANFVLTNPNLPGCPIIYVSPGFLELTRYEAGQVLGKNCRFLQGPGTDPGAVSILRNNLMQGRDSSVCILNYKADGTPFWNQLSIGNLLDSQGLVANHIGVLYEVKPMTPGDFRKQLHRVPLPESLLNDSLDSEEDNSQDKMVSRSRHSTAALRPVARICSRSNSGIKMGPARVVDSLRRTRAAASPTAGYTAESIIR